MENSRFLSFFIFKWFLHGFFVFNKTRYTFVWLKQLYIFVKKNSIKKWLIINAFLCIFLHKNVTNEMKTSIHFNACLWIFLHKSIEIFVATRRLIMKTSIHTLFNAFLGIFMHENVKIFAATRRMVMVTSIYFNAFLCISCIKMSKFSLLRGEW